METSCQIDWYRLPAEQAYDSAAAEERVRAISATAMAAAQIDGAVPSNQEYEPFALMADMAEAQDACVYAEIQAEKWLCKQQRDAALAWVSEQISTCGLSIVKLAKLSGLSVNSISQYRHQRKQPMLAQMNALTDAIANIRNLQEDERWQLFRTGNEHAYYPYLGRQSPTAAAFQKWFGGILQIPSIYIRELSRQTDLGDNQIYSMLYKGMGVTAVRIFTLAVGGADILGLKEAERYDFIRAGLTACRVLPETWPDPFQSVT